MGQPRPCALMLISVEREQLQSVDYEVVIDEFTTSPEKTSYTVKTECLIARHFGLLMSGHISLL